MHFEEARQLLEIKQYYMKAIKLLSVCLILICFAANINAQGDNYRFIHSKSIGDKLVIYFKIIDLPNDLEEQDKVLAILLKDDLISDGNIYSEEKATYAICQLEIESTASVKYVQNLIQESGYDIDLSSLIPSNAKKPKGIYNSEGYSFFEGFNAWLDFDINNVETVSAEKHYKAKKADWIASNSDQYGQSKKERGTTVIVKRKDLEFFQEEKRQHILSHPEIYIIED